MEYSVSVNPVRDAKTSVKGYANVVFGGSFKVTNIAILENRKGELYVSMPSYKSMAVDEKNRSVYKDICNPITKEFRESLYGDILSAFKHPHENRSITAKDGTAVKEPEFAVKMSSYEREGSNIRGIGRVYFADQFVVSNVLVLQGRDKLFVSMPNYKTNQVDQNNKAVYQDVCYPVTKEFRAKLYEEVLSCYQKEREKALGRNEKTESYGNPEPSIYEKQDTDKPLR